MTPPTPFWIGARFDALEAKADAAHKRLRLSLDDDHREVMAAMQDLTRTIVNLRERVITIETERAMEAKQLIGRRAWAAVVIATSVSLGMQAMRWIATGHP